MERSIRELWWDVQFYLEITALVAIATLIPLGAVAAITYGMIADKQGFILGGVTGIFPGMAIVIWAACALVNSPDA